MPLENDANKEKCCIIKENQKAQNNSHEHKMMHNEILSFFLMCFILETKRRKANKKREAHFSLVMDGKTYCEMFCVTSLQFAQCSIDSLSQAKSFSKDLNKFISIPHWVFT
jgi:hypothetical protein